MKTSFGIILVVNNKVLVLEKMVPYCVESYFRTTKSWSGICESRHKRKKKIDPWFANRRSIATFEKKKFCTLSMLEKMDYSSYKKGAMFEDKFDFPKGRKRGNESEITAALREFKEETGYQFDNFTISKTVEYIFRGLDDQYYMQKFFVIKDPPNLQKVKGNKTATSLLYYVRFLSKEHAKILFTLQQQIKCDNKHKLFLDDSVMI